MEPVDEPTKLIILLKLKICKNIPRLQAVYQAFQPWTVHWDGGKMQVEKKAHAALQGSQGSNPGPTAC